MDPNRDNIYGVTRLGSSTILPISSYLRYFLSLSLQAKAVANHAHHTPGSAVPQHHKQHAGMVHVSENFSSTVVADGSLAVTQGPYLKSARPAPLLGFDSSPQRELPLPLPSAICPSCTRTRTWHEWSRMVQLLATSPFGGNSLNDPHPTPLSGNPAWIIALGRYLCMGVLTKLSRHPPAMPRCPHAIVAKLRRRECRTLIATSDISAPLSSSHRTRNFSRYLTCTVPPRNSIVITGS